MIPPEYMAFEQTVTVGCANFERGASKADSLARIEAAIAEASAQGIDILVFPECALMGAIDCSCRFDGGACPGHRELAETVPGPSSEHIAMLAKKFDMYVVFGMSERDPGEPSVLYNSAVVVGPEGILGTYRKLHLGTLPLVTEGITYRPGSSLPLFATRFGPIGVLIDYDFWFNPELSRILMLKGARLLVNLSGALAGPGKRDYLVHTTAARAQENLVYTASANLVGGAERTEHSAGNPSNPHANDYLGHSVIAGPAFPRYSQVFVEAGDTVEIVSATLSFERLHRWDTVFPIRQWRAGRQLAASRLIADEFAALAQEPVIASV
jgi:predicted amidohydrolase